MIERAVTDLPDPEFADKPEGLTTMHGEGHAIDSRQLATPQAKPHGELVECQNRLGHMRLARRGFVESRAYDGRTSL